RSNKMQFLIKPLYLSLLCILPYIESAKILAVFPFPGPSQYILVQPYLKALIAKGHNLTVINAFPQKQPIANFRDVIVSEVHDNYADLIQGAQYERNKWDEMTFLCDFFSNVTETVLKSDRVQNLLKTEKFDLVILEALHTDAWYTFGRHFKAPMIGLSSFGTDPIIDELMGNMSPLSYVPLVTAGLTERMTYGERFKNSLYSLMEQLHVRVVHLPRHRDLIKKYLPHMKDDIWDLRTNFSLMLLNQHFSLSFPRPYVPSMIEVGGFQIHYKPQPLPKEMLDFINSSAEDVIYFSMGSNVKSKDFPPERLQMINEVFASLPYKIMWKFENPILPGKPENVFISPWFPQPDILAHPRVKLFISHGGLLSTTEAIYHGKPMLGLPVFYDQAMNIRKAIQSGFALGLNFETLPRDEFKSSILEMMHNTKYIDNIKTISRIYHDQPMKPLDVAIYWTEYVLRHKGALHLQNPAQKMSFIQKHSIDTVGVMIAFAILLYILVQPYLKALAAKGHEMTVINAFPQKQSIANFRDVPVIEVHDNYAELVESAKIKRNKWEEMTFMAGFFLNLTETVVKNPGVQKLLNNEKFDLVIVEALHTDAWYAFARHFNAPLIGLSSFGTDPIIDELMGNMSPLSYSPLITAGLTERMTYGERLKNVILSYLEVLHARVHTIPRQRKLIETYLPHIKEDIWELRTNFSLMLLNNHFSLSFPRPYVPNMVEVGGFQISYKSKPVPQDIMNFINSSAQDVIYFSMGSNVKSKDFPAEKLQMLNEVFSSLPYKILWKFENPTLPGKPDNVFIKSWFPQPDVLAHPRIKLFISHGGLLSTSEAVYHGKPMLGLPVFYDQQMNIRKAVQSGFALDIDFHTLPREQFKSSILEIMKNPKYLNNAKTISNIFHDRPVKPLDLAVYWTEYVLRHKGAVHLQNPAQKMNFVQKYSIDTVGVLVAALVLCVIVVIVTVLKIVKFVFEKKSTKKEKGLAERGHEVTSISTFPQKTPLKNFRDIAVMENSKLFETLMTEAVEESNEKGFFREMREFGVTGYKMVSNVLEHPKVKHIMKNEKFDLILVETILSEALYGLGEYFQAPMVGVSTFGTINFVDYLVGNVSPMSYIPHISLPYENHMNLKERILNVVTHIIDDLHYNYIMLPPQEKLYKKYFPSAKLTLDEAQRNFSLVLINQHFTLSYPRPYVPNMIEVGGLHIKQQPDPLPMDLKEFLDNAHEGAIYFSMGSNLKSKDIPAETLKVFLDTFRELNVKVLWKFEAETLPQKPDNVFIKAWYPQPSVLAHPNVKLFISHGGFLSTTETIFHGKPILGIPVFGDQPMNVKNAVKSGYALSLKLDEITKESFKSSIMELLSNERYTKRVQQLSRNYRDQPLTPLETAIYWIEYVLRNEGAVHMRNAGQDLNYWQRNSIDVDIAVMENAKLFDTFTNEAVGEEKKETNFFEEFAEFSEIGVKMVQNVLENPKVKDIMKNEKFDLIIVETLCDALYGFGQHFNAPMVGVSTFGTINFIDVLVNNISPMSYIPHMGLPYDNHMNLKERLWNVIFNIIDDLHFNFIRLPPQEKLFHKYFPKSKHTFDEARKNVSLVLLNQHFTLSYPRPYVTNMIEVGGLHIKQKPDSLPQDLQEFLDNATDGAIYFSMGSNLKSKDIPAETLKVFLDTFRELKVKVLWKFEAETLPNKPDNVFIKAWYPQPSVLAHPNAKLFISHGGFLSTTETIFHGKPILGIPVFGDQPMNVNNAVKSGYALSLKLHEITKESFKSSIMELLTNDRYTKRVQQLSKRYRDQPQTPLEKAIYWIEYVLRHEGAVHMRNPGVDLNYFQQYNLDVFAILVACLLLALAALVAVVGFVAKLLGGKKKSKKSSALLKGLAERGHEITSISTFPQKTPIKNFRDIAVMENAKLFESVMSTAVVDKKEKTFFEELFEFSEFGYQMVKNVMENSQVKDILKNEKFDLIILEALYCDALYGLGQHFNAPMVGVSTFGTINFVDVLVNNISPMSYIPHMSLSYDNHMNLQQRLINVIASITDDFLHNFLMLPPQKELFEKYFPSSKLTFEEARKNFSLVLLNQHFTLGFPRPLVPNMIDVGGLHISQKPDPLPQDLQEFLDNATEGAIYFSMGSNLKSKDIPAETLKVILDTFRELKVKVLWKFEDESLPNKPDNVFIKSWYPQPSVLAHPNVKLFISHGGFLSTTETIFHAKPILGIPVFGDQPMNVKNAVKAGYALSLQLDEITKESFKSTIIELLTNDRYTKRVQQLSRRYRDQPQTPLETAIYWIEYVLRHEGAPHLRNAGMDLNYIQQYNIDVFAILAVVFLMIIIVFVICIHLLVRCICGNGKSKKTVGASKVKRPSQYIMASALLKGLAERGHEVTSISTFPQKTPVKNFRDIAVMENSKLYEATMTEAVGEEKKKSFFDELFEFTNVGVQMVTNVLEHPKVKDIMKNEKFDLIIVEALLCDALYGLGQHFNAPLVAVSTFGTINFVDVLVNNISPMSYIPHISLPYDNRMNLQERLVNVVSSVLDDFCYNFLMLPPQKKLFHKYFPSSQMTFDEVRKNVSLVLLNQHFTLSYPRPYVTNMIEVGGLHIKQKPDPLPQDLQQFLDNATEGAIYFSMGSNLKSKDIPAETLKVFLDTFRELKVKVLWKFEAETLPNKPDNVFIKAWYPQPSVLAHPNVKLFISHGGFLSTTETIFHGKPILGIPVFGDQPMNVKNAVKSGYALSLQLKEITKNSFKSTIMELLSNDRYTKRVQQLSKRYRDQPQTPLEKAIYWIEYVLRHDGAVHMRNPGVDLNYFQQYNLDVFAILAVGLIAVITVMFKFNSIVNFLILLYLWQTPKRVEAAKILGIFALPQPAKYTVTTSLVNALHERGHDVTLIIRCTNQLEVSAHIRKIIIEDREEIRKDFFKFSSENLDQSFYHKLQNIFGKGAQTVVNIFNNTQFRDIMKNEKFDMIMLDTFMTEALYGLEEYFNASLVGVSNFGSLTSLDTMVGNVSPLSFIPSLFIQHTFEVTFWQRCLNVALYAVDVMTYELLHKPLQHTIYKDLFPNATLTFDQACRNFALVLLNQHFSLSFARPYVPNMIEVAGLHIKEELQQLPFNIQQFLDNSSQGIIYFYLGVSEDLFNANPNNSLIVLKTLKDLNYNIVWNMHYMPIEFQKFDNILHVRNVSHYSLLAHPYIKLFVTNGELLSIIEAVYYAKPILGLPMFADQHVNINMAIKTGYGLGLILKQLNELKLKQTIFELLNNSRYANKIKELSNVFHDQPIKPLDKSIYWLEYVLRHKGAKQLRVKGRFLNFWQFHNIDVFLAFLLVFAILVFIIWFITKSIYLLLHRSKQNLQNKVKIN
ncbi:hypothetical protein FF38_13551, partial [Lucilia cuprina]